MAAGGMADRRDAAQVEGGIDVREAVDRGRDVVGSRRPAAAVSEPAVLDVPGDDPAGRQVGAQRVHQVQVVAGSPEPAV